MLFGESTLFSIVEAITWAVEQNADVINMSFGSGRYEPQLAYVLDFLVNTYDILPVVAVGNEYHGNTRSPGNAFSALSVGAVERVKGSRKPQVSEFSSGASLVLPTDTSSMLGDQAGPGGGGVLGGVAANRPGWRRVL